MRVFLLALAILAAPPAHSAELFTGSGRDARRAESAYHFSLGTQLAYGNMQSEDTTSVVSRGMAVIGFDGAFGLRWHAIVLAAAAEYRFWRQVRSPSNFGGVNTQGGEFAYGPLLGFDFESFSLLGKYYLGSHYSFSRPDEDGFSQEYLSPDNSFAVQLRIPAAEGNSYYGLEYRSVTFEKVKANEQDHVLTPDSHLNATSIGLIFGFSF